MFPVKKEILLIKEKSKFLQLITTLKVRKIATKIRAITKY